MINRVFLIFPTAGKARANQNCVDAVLPFGTVRQRLLQSVRKRTKLTRLDLHEVFCAVLCLLRTGCQ